MCSVDNTNRIAAFLDVPLGKVGYNSEKILTRTKSAQEPSISGFSSIIQSLVRETKKPAVKQLHSDFEVECQILQWLDYAVLFVAPSNKDKHAAKSLLEELNYYLQSRSYLVNDSLSVADVVVFHTIHETMANLQPLEKENFLNVSRWFHHLQHLAEVRQGKHLLNFSTLQLLEWATGTHT
ncbi:eukaryotic translation elongation factor 1 epsilon-1 [Anopheles ziemanni]|uniref:eukaryotic translation elongation factor 1 epsilon-1 n=1 Tax=Anopheles coustani TaxID=139045 RepID=UPI00265992C8|nr:eukaryotic translation elongation factor 1 epsilon-1 [Anopheles coustani]XP_058166547.1 eukaryotic translation elongation factor 1 epsilon-1 [Anopheles ziemanni]